MKQLMRLFALAVTACGCSVPDRELKDIPGLAISVRPTSSSAENVSVVLSYPSSLGEDCYRISADARLTINGEAAVLEHRGDMHLGSNGAYSCEYPASASLPGPADASRTEFILSDGRSSMRAVFQGTLRRVRVNGQEQPTLLSGGAVDIEWFPATDQLEEVDLALLEDGISFHLIYNPDIEGNHIRFKLSSMEAGPYVMHVNSKGSAGVEACEGFSSCHAGLDERIEVPFVIE